jgi:acyl-CoA thioester hydrolase
MNGYNTRLELRVDWADLDLFGHVNNVAFFRYMQAARVNYCELIGLTSLNEKDRLSFMVASSRCTFKKPLHYPNHLAIFTKVDWVKNSSLQLSYAIVDINSQTIAEGEDVIVVYDHEQKIKRAIAPDIRQKIEEREGKTI